MVLETKTMIREAFGEKINLEYLDLITEGKLARLIVDLDNNKEKCISANKQDHEGFDLKLNYFMGYFKKEARKFNLENNLHISFGGYFIRCLREIKTQGNQLSESEVQCLFQAATKAINNPADLEGTIKITLKRLKEYALDPTVSKEEFIYFSNRYLIDRTRAVELGMDSGKMKKYDQVLRGIFTLRMGGTGIQN
jgi:hypothetical protein